MLSIIWQTIGIIVGMCILIPLLIFVSAIFYGCVKSLIKLCFACADTIATRVDEWIHKK